MTESPSQKNGHSERNEKSLLLLLEFKTGIILNFGKIGIFSIFFQGDVDF
jgi:hypothetical protein